MRFIYDSEGNLIEDKSKNLKISYDWRGMPTEFVRKIGCYDYHGVALCDSVKLVMAYDGSGRRISKTRMMKTADDGDWYVNNVTHYTGIGTEVRETHVNGQDETKVVVKSLQGESRKNKLACSYDRTAAADAKGVHMPQGLGCYTPEDAVDGLNGVSGSQLAGYRPPAKFEWYLKNHIGSTMLVYGTSAYNDPLNSGYKGGVKAAYNYRAFGEQVTFTEPTDKVTENFTGKEKDDETELNYFGARYLDPMLGLWTSVDPARQFASPYLYAGNGVNPVNVIDPDGNETEESSNNECQTVLERIWNAAVGVIHSANEWVKVEAQSFDVLRKETVSRPSGANVDVENVQRAQKNVHKGVQVLPKEVMKGSIGKVVGIGVDAVIGAAKDDGENSLEPVQRPSDFDDFGQEEVNSLWNK